MSAASAMLYQDDPVERVRRQQECYARCTAEGYSNDPDEQLRVQAKCYDKCMGSGKMGDLLDDLLGGLGNIGNALLPGTPFQGTGVQGGCGCGPRGSAAGMAVLNGDVQLVAAPQRVQRDVAPCGYVLVCKANGQKVAMLKEVAYALGLKKRPSKRGGISARDIRTALHVQKVVTGLTVKRAPRVPLKSGKRKAS